MIFKKNDLNGLIAKYQEKLKKDQDRFLRALDINSYDSWYYDQPSGVFELSKEEETIYFEFQSISTFSRKTNTWLWAWANKHTYPNVRSLSEKIEEYGLKHNYIKLIEETWDAEEVDGWEMLSIANKLFKPLGVYRIDTEDIPMFIILTKQLSSDEAHELKEKSEQLADCHTHGLRRHAFVCQHLGGDTSIGFHESFDTWEGMELDDDNELQAWCDECEKIRVKYDGWNEESQKLIKIKLVCEGCYFDMKRVNK